MIRHAQVEDLPALSQLYQQLTNTFAAIGPGHAATPQMLPMRLHYYQQILTQQEGIILVAEEGDTIVGMIVCEYRTADKAFQWRKMVVIQDLFILPPHREHGMARELCERALARCKADGREIVYIWITPTNTIMEEQSKAWGFQPEYTIKTKLL